MKNWFFHLLGLHDREQKARTKAVNVYVEEKKGEFNNDMKRMQKIMKRAHLKATQTQAETAKLIEVAEGITAKIARSSGVLK